MDTKKLPSAALFDTCIMIRALGQRKDSRSANCKSLLSAMVESGKTVYVAAPTIAELERFSDPLSVPSVKSIVVVPVDRLVATLLGRNFQFDDTMKLAEQLERTSRGIKYDTLIASCAIRMKVGVVTIDSRFSKVCAKANIRCFSPDEFLSAQISIRSV